MFSLDRNVSAFAAQMYGHTPALDWLMMHLLQKELVKFLPLILLLIWLWFSAGWGERRRNAVLCGFVGAFVSIVTTRVVQNLVPRTPRPALSGLFDFGSAGQGMPDDWSSFPSDSSGFGFALAMGVFLASRRLGVPALLWALFVVDVPRIYNGYHYLSDIIAGSAIGVASTLVVARVGMVQTSLGRVTEWARLHQAWFYCFAYFVAWEYTRYLEDARRLVEFLHAHH